MNEKEKFLKSVSQKHRAIVTVRRILSFSFFIFENYIWKCIIRHIY